MSIISETMKKWADENEIALDEVQLERFEDYAKILVEWNEKIQSWVGILQEVAESPRLTNGRRKNAK